MKMNFYRNILVCPRPHQYINCIAYCQHVSKSQILHCTKKCSSEKEGLYVSR